jgi:hypothetical protein
VVRPLEVVPEKIWRCQQLAPGYQVLHELSHLILRSGKGWVIVSFGGVVNSCLALQTFSEIVDQLQNSFLTP